MEAHNSITIERPNRGRLLWFLKLFFTCALLVSACFKTYSLFMFGHFGIFSPATVPFVVFVEVLLSLWFVSRFAVHLNWLVTFVLLTLAVGFHFASLFRGWSACGCFGTFEVSPLMMVFLTGGALAMWTLSMPNRVLFHLRKEVLMLNHSPEVSGRVVGGLLFTIVLSCVLRFGLLTPIAAGETGLIAITPDVIEIGDLMAEKPIEVKVVVRNRSTSPLRIIGGGTSCGCVVLTSFPIALVPLQDLELPIAYTPMHQDIGRVVEKKFRYYLDHPSQGYVDGTIRSRVIDREQ